MNARVPLYKSPASTGESGFTLIEIVAALTIMAILLTIALYAMIGTQQRSRSSTAIATGKTIESAVALFNHDHPHIVNLANPALTPKDPLLWDAGIWDSGTPAAGTPFRAREFVIYDLVGRSDQLQEDTNPLNDNLPEVKIDAGGKIVESANSGGAYLQTWPKNPYTGKELTVYRGACPPAPAGCKAGDVLIERAPASAGYGAWLITIYIEKKLGGVKQVVPAGGTARNDVPPIDPLDYNHKLVTQ